MDKEQVQKLLKILKALGFSYGELSSLLDIPRTVISNRTYGKRYPSPINLLIILQLKEIVMSKHKDGTLTKDNIIQEVYRLRQTPAFVRILSKKYSERNYIITKSKILSATKSCQLCGAMGMGIDAHHIIFRSEAPNHPNLHHENNIIVACRKCHDAMHRIKSLRNKLIEDRGLYILFPEILHK